MRGYTLLRNARARFAGKSRLEWPTEEGDVLAAYRFSAQVIGRSAGRTATAAAAYRAGAEIADERTGLIHDYRRRGGVTHTEILLPEGAPGFAQDRARLWNAVEAVERRKDAQLAREVLLNLPHELTADERCALARRFVRETFVAKGMVADLSIHAPDTYGDQRNHHAHVLLAMRPFKTDQSAVRADKDAFDKKERAWNDRDQLEAWRADWAKAQNIALERAGHTERVDHRSLADQGIDREPEPKLGPVATQMERDNRPSKAGDDLRATWQRNADREWLAAQAEITEAEIAHGELSQSAPASQRKRGTFDTLFDRQAQALGNQHRRQQQSVDDLAAQLDGRHRLAVFWDKLRGRLGWNAEMELEASRSALRETEERQRFLAAARDHQRQLENRQQEERQRAEVQTRNSERRADDLKTMFDSPMSDGRSADQRSQDVRGMFEDKPSSDRRRDRSDPEPER